MTIGSTVTQTSGSQGNGVTVTFNFTFSVEAYGAVSQAEQIQVIKETIATGVEEIQTLTTHYTTSFNADQNVSPGGSIAMVTAPSSAYKIWIRLNPSFLQATDYQNQGGFLMETVEDQADQQQRQINVLQDRIRRAPRVGIQAGAAFDGEIAGDLTAGYAPIVKSDLSGWQLGAPSSVAVSAAMAPVVQAATLAEGRSAFGLGAEDSPVFTALALGSNPAIAGTLCLPNAGWIAGRNALNSADLNLFRINSDNYTEWSNPLYYSDGAFVARNAKLTIAANTATPTGIFPAVFILHEGKGDNATFIGVAGGYFQARDRSDVTPSNKGVLYSLHVDVHPLTARGSSSPNDDAVALAISNSGTAKATEAIYIGNNVTIVGPEFASAIQIDCDADDVLNAGGQYTNGIDFVTGGPATFTGHAILLPNNEPVGWRNAANNANLEVLNVDASDILQIGSGVLSLASSKAAAWTGLHTFTTASAQVAPASIVSTDAGAGFGPRLDLNRQSGSAAGGDGMGEVRFLGRSDNGTERQYASIRAYIADAANGLEDGAIPFLTLVNGALDERMKVQAGVTIGAPTGDDKGVGTLNIDNGLYLDGVKVVGAQGAAVANAAGGATVDAEARAAINALLARVRTHGLIAT